MWKTVKLGEVCHFQNGRAFKKSEWSESGLPIIRIQNLKNERTEHNYYEGEYDERIFVTNGDLLLSWSGTVKPFIWCHGDALLNQHVFKVSASTQINQGYSFYLFQNILDEISKQKVGIGLQHITKKTFENFRVTLPPLEEQQRIVQKLDRAFAEIDRAIELQVSRDIFLEVFIAKCLYKFLTNFELAARCVKVSDICKLMYGKALDNSERTESGGIPTYGANGIKTYATKALCKKPSIIIGRKGSAGELTKVTQPFWALDVTYYTEVDEEMVDLDFLYFTLKTMNLPSLAKGVKPGINRNDVYSKKVMLPTLAEQQKIVTKLKSIYAQCDLAKGLALNVQQQYHLLKSSILKKALQPPQQ